MKCSIAENTLDNFTVVLIGFDALKNHLFPEEKSSG
jgi:hypothetical protein